MTLEVPSKEEFNLDEKTMEIIQEIDRMKKERNAVIVAHNYQVDDVQDLADIVGDSLKLS